MPGLTRTSNVITPPVWAGDYLGRDHLLPGPIELDPTAFTNEDGDFVVVGAGAAAGATSVTVGALANAIPSGTILNFGTYAPVTVTVNDSSVSAGDVGITVVALPGPIPGGTRLNFSGGTNAQVVEVNGDHAAGATTLVVLPLDGTVANSATALFPGGTKMARLTANAAAGATTLTVDELQFALATSDAATYTGAGVLGERVPAGTYVGRTFAERESGTAFGPVASGDEERYLIAFDVLDLTDNVTATAVRHNSVIKENFLPGYGTMTSTIKGYLRADYSTQKGAN